jgi:hypothetical protein
MRAKLLKIQTELKSPKLQRNDFGKYNYRSCEDILEAVKPLLHKYNCCLIITDDIIEVGGRIYVKSTVRIENDEGSIVQASAFAREADIQKGMSEPQITGSASSYARKYALNGLFLIDDTRDDDATNTHGKDKTENKPEEKQKGDLKGALKAILESKTIENLDKICKLIDLRLWTDEEAKELDFANSDKRSQLK